MQERVRWNARTSSLECKNGFARTRANPLNPLTDFVPCDCPKNVDDLVIVRYYFWNVCALLCIYHRVNWTQYEYLGQLL